MVYDKPWWYDHKPEEITCLRCRRLSFGLAGQVIGILAILAWFILACVVFGVMALLSDAKAQSGSYYTGTYRNGAEYSAEAMKRLEYEKQFIPSADHPYLVKLGPPGPHGEENIVTVYPEGWYHSPLGQPTGNDGMRRETRCWMIGHTWTCR